MVESSYDVISKSASLLYFRQANCHIPRRIKVIHSLIETYFHWMLYNKSSWIKPAHGTKIRQQIEESYEHIFFVEHWSQSAETSSTKELGFISQPFLSIHTLLTFSGLQTMQLWQISFLFDLLEACVQYNEYTLNGLCSGGIRTHVLMDFCRLLAKQFNIF